MGLLRILRLARDRMWHPSATEEAEQRRLASIVRLSEIGAEEKTIRAEALERAGMSDRAKQIRADAEIELRQARSVQSQILASLPNKERL